MTTEHELRYTPSNCFDTSPEIKKLRKLHAAMDRAVLDASGWTDLKPTCEFLLFERPGTSPADRAWNGRGDRWAGLPVY